jgi:hypothetical protein
MTIGIVILAVYSLIILGCFAAYIFQAVRGNSPTLSLLDGYHGDLSIWQKAFLIIAAIALMICIFQGVEAMLFWMPDEWGKVNEDGEYVTAKNTLAVLFITFGGLPFLKYLADAGPATIFAAHYEERFYTLEKIVDALLSADNIEGTGNLWELRAVKVELEKKISKLEEELQEIETFNKYVRHPTGQRLGSLTSLISIVENLEQKFCNN